MKRQLIIFLVVYFSIVNIGYAQYIQNIDFLPKIEAGFVRPCSSTSAINSKFFQTVEVQLDFISLQIKDKERKWWFESNYGFHLAEYEIKGQKYISTDKSGVVTLEEYPDYSKDRRSTIYTYGMQINLHTYYSFRNDKSIGIGFIWMLSNGLCRNSYKQNDDGKTTFLYDLSEINRHRFGGRIDYSFDVFNIYFKYIPTKVFNGNKGPSFSSISFGAGIRFK